MPSNISTEPQLPSAHRGEPSDPLARRIQDVYTKFPFPTDKSLAKDLPHSVALLGWMRAAVPPGSSILSPDGPRRILVAGCGTGFEAFAMARAFPRSDILGVDFSPTAIDAANASKTEEGIENVSFEIADLSAVSLVSRLETGSFDFIACSGVLMHVPAFPSALGNLADLLSETGTLYLAVNGTRHISARARAALQLWSERCDEFKNTVVERERLAFIDSIHRQKPPLASMDASMLSLDVFTPGIHNLALREWVGSAAERGLVFYSAQGPVKTLNAASDPMTHSSVLDVTHARLCAIIEEIQPCAYHRMVFGHKPAVQPPWTDRKRLGAWIPSLHSIDPRQIPAMAPPFDATCEATLRLPGIVEVRRTMVSRYILEFLRLCDGACSIDRIVGTIPFAASDGQLTAILNHFWHCGLVRLDPPQGGVEVPPWPSGLVNKQ